VVRWGGACDNGAQAAARLGVGRTTLNRWIKRGRVTPAELRHGVLLFDKEAIDHLAGQGAC